MSPYFEASRDVQHGPEHQPGPKHSISFRALRILRAARKVEEVLKKQGVTCEQDPFLIMAYNKQNSINSESGFRWEMFGLRTHINAAYGLVGCVGQLG